jgi:hypothetical protein
MGDADDSYDFSALQGLLDQLRAGYDLVMGNRFWGGIRQGAMPMLHRYLGNPVLSFLGRLFFRSPVGDFHCGLRGFSRDAIIGLDLRTSGMEFASEMVVKATLAGLRIAEVPIVLYQDARSRPPHLRSWRDGWRHLRFLLLFSPEWLFLYPGMSLFLIGAIGEFALFVGPVRLGPFTLDIHTMLFAAVATLVGVQMIWLALFSRVVGVQKGILPAYPKLDRLVSLLTVERGSLAGGALVLLGLVFAIAAVVQWEAVGFGALDPRSTMRYSIVSMTATVMGVELVVASFFLGVIALPGRRRRSDLGAGTSSREGPG